MARTSIQIANSSKRDSSSMKSLAVLSIIFLPPSCIAAIVSMPMLSWQPGEFWIFWAVTLPITAVTIIIWIAWMRWIGHQNRNSDAQVVSNFDKIRRMWEAYGADSPANSKRSSNGQSGEATSTRRNSGQDEEPISTRSSTGQGEEPISTRSSSSQDEEARSDVASAGSGLERGPAGKERLSGEPLMSSDRPSLRQILRLLWLFFFW
ncbi:hypothetical protein IWZ01DRAFT_490195 [Phyllosticta capitalensis]